MYEIVYFEPSLTHDNRSIKQWLPFPSNKISHHCLFYLPVMLTLSKTPSDTAQSQIQQLATNFILIEPQIQSQCRKCLPHFNAFSINTAGEQLAQFHSSVIIEGNLISTLGILFATEMAIQFTCWEATCLVQHKYNHRSRYNLNASPHCTF